MGSGKLTIFVQKDHMLHKTRGIVLKTTFYGDTGVVVQVFTEKFGIQALMEKVKTEFPKVETQFFDSANPA